MMYALIVADFLTIGLFIIKFPTLPPQIPIFYSRTWGEDQLGSYWYIFLLPFLLHAFVFMNIYLYNQLFFPDRLMKKIIDYVNWFYLIGFVGMYLKIILLIS